MFYGQKLSAAYGVCCRPEACVIYRQHLAAGDYIAIVAGLSAAGSVDPSPPERVVLPPQALTSGRPYNKKWMWHGAQRKGNERRSLDKAIVVQALLFFSRKKKGRNTWVCCITPQDKYVLFYILEKGGGEDEKDIVGGAG